MSSELAKELQAAIQKCFESEVAERKATGSKVSAAAISAGAVLLGLYKLADYAAALEGRLAAIEAKGVAYCGVWQRAQDYKRGDVVTFDGSAWVAIAEETRATPGATDAWQMLVKGTR